MSEKFTAAQWAEMEGGHEVTPSEEPKFAFLQDIHESRMTKDNGSSRKLTYTDCGERMYLTLLALETMRQYPDFKGAVQRYAKKTSGFELYKYYRIMGTDLYNFLYFLWGSQDKLKDPQAAKKIALTVKKKLPIMDINRHIQYLGQGREPTLTTKLFISIESALNITNADYKMIRRGLQGYAKLTKQEKERLVTRLIFAVRAKLRSSDIIDDFEKFAAIKDLESPLVIDPEPTVSTPDISTAIPDFALYKYLVGAGGLQLTKAFLNNVKDGKATSAAMNKAYSPAVKMIDDIVQGGPAYVQQLRALADRAKRGR
jgi:hypothetical protein